MRQPAIRCTGVAVVIFGGCLAVWAQSPVSAPASPTAPDPAASELDQINQLINDINNSIQDSSNQGGE